MTLPRPRALEPAVTLLCAIALAMVMTYPYSLHPGSVGRVDAADGRLSIWNVAWIAHALLDDPGQLFNANIFYPNPHTLFYSEANLAAGVLAVPAYWLTRNPYTAHNTVFVLTFILSALAMYALARRLTGSRGASAFAAIAFAYTPFVFAHTAHIQLLFTAGLPLSLLAFHRFVDRPGTGRALQVSLALAATALGCGYYGLYAGMLVGLGALVYGAARGLWRRPLYWGRLGLAAIVSVLIVWPLLGYYMDLQEADAGLRRSIEGAATYSSTWRDYFTSSAWAHRWMLPYLKSWMEVLFPGFLTVALGAAGLWLGLRRPREATAPGTAVADAPVARRREHTTFYGLVALLALWGSFGPQAGLYTALYYALPFMSLVRAPARFGLLVAMALAILAAFAVDRLLTWSGRSRPWVAVGLAAMLALELTVVPLGTFPALYVPWAHRVLARLPRHPVVEFPFFADPNDRFEHTIYMLYSTAHWQPLINGYSDHIPQEFRKTAAVIATFPSPEAFAILEARGARYAVVHLPRYDPAVRPGVEARLAQYDRYLRLLMEDERARLYEIVAWPGDESAAREPSAADRLEPGADSFTRPQFSLPYSLR